MLNRKIAIYGYGSLGKIVEAFLQEDGIQPRVIIDNYKCDHATVSFDEFKKIYKDGKVDVDAVIISISDNLIMEECIQELTREDIPYGIILNVEEVLQNRKMTYNNILWSDSDGSLIEIYRNLWAVARRTKEKNDEIYWAHIYHDTVKESDWLAENSEARKNLRKYLMRKMHRRDYINILRRIINFNGLEYVSYAQNCEDVIAKKLLDEMLNYKKGTYVDIGAHDPIRFSNTYLLYLENWNGINIDPLPKSKERFDIYRPDDINLSLAISSEKTSDHMCYYEFEEPAYNTLDLNRAEKIKNNKISKLINKRIVEVERLETVLDKFLEEGSNIDFLTIDVETRELDVLKSNNWEKYRPKLICCESIVSSDKSIDRLKDDNAITFLITQGYEVVAKVQNAVFLREV